MPQGLPLKTLTCHTLFPLKLHRETVTELLIMVEAKNTGVYPEGLEIPVLTFADRGHVFFLFVVVVFSAMKCYIFP